MVEIPANTQDKKQEQIDVLTKCILNDLKISNRSDVYHTKIPSLEIAKEVGYAFKKKGYYAKITYFVERWKGFQKLSVSKSPMKEASARMIYDEML